MLVGEVRSETNRRTLSFDSSEHVPAEEKRQAPVECAGDYVINRLIRL